MAQVEERRGDEAQWGLGYHEPLNPTERIERDRDGRGYRCRTCHGVWEPAHVGLGLHEEAG